MLSQKLTVTDKQVISGEGMVAIARIEPGEVIWEPSGSIVTTDQKRKIFETLGRAFRFSQIDQDLYAENIGQEWEMNHSCNPNCVLLGRKIIARHVINPGDEVTYDYGLTEIGLSFRIHCRCGHQKCRRAVSNEDYKDARLVRARGAEIADYVLLAASRVTWWDRCRFQLKRAVWRARYTLFGVAPLRGVWRSAAAILRQLGLGR